MEEICTFYEGNQILCFYALGGLELEQVKRFVRHGMLTDEFCGNMCAKFKVSEEAFDESWETAKKKIKQRLRLKKVGNELWQLPISWPETLELLARAGISRLGDLRDRERLLKIKGIGNKKADEIAAALRIWDEKFAPLPEPPPTAAAAELQPNFAF